MALSAGLSPAYAQQESGLSDSPARDRSELQADQEDDSPLDGTFRTGVEYDSNARRTSGDGVVGDGLSRYFVALRGEYGGDGDSQLSVGLRHGGKLFFNERGSDALLTRVGLQYQHALGGGVYGLLEADMKDRQERTSGPGEDVTHQDYNRGGAETGVGWSSGPFHTRASVGYRYFAFRPNPSSSSHGPQASGSLSYHIHRNVRLRTSYTFSARNFDAIRFTRRTTDGGDTVVQRDRDGRLRDDLLHLVRVGGSYRGAFILQLHYVLLRNLSNSYGQAMTRHGLELDATIPLWWELYVSAKLQLQRTSYEDPLFLSADLQVDEENRNSAVASLTRTVGDHWELEARYRVFIEEFGVASDYRRQTGFLGVGYVF